MLLLPIGDTQPSPKATPLNFAVNFPSLMAYTLKYMITIIETQNRGMIAIACEFMNITII